MRRIARSLASTGVAIVLVLGSTAGAWAADSSAQPSAPAGAQVSAPRTLTTSGIGGAQLDLAGVQANLGPEAKPLPEIWADTWLLADATTGEVLAAKGAHVQRPPASTLKALTAITLLPQLSLDSTTVATPKASRVSGTRVGLIDGKTYSIRDLMYALMLASGNDAAIALAQANGGVKKTVREMNQVAATLHANDTVAKTPNGLDKSGQVSSAYDLALFARAGLARPDFAEIVKTTEWSFPGKGKSQHPIYNQNRLLDSGYKGAAGVKMGFTSKAGRTFIAAATRKGHTLVFVGMGIKDHSDAAARKALTWGFKNRTKVTPVGTLVAADEVTTQAMAQTPEPTVPPVDLSTAGLDVPTADDPMAPWWFWTILFVAAVAAVAGLRFSRGRRRERGGVGPSNAIRVDYHPYDPR